MSLSHRNPLRLFAVLIGFSLLASTIAVALPPLPARAEGVIQITEWMYSGGGGEFVELTNTGDEPIDLTGWSYDDDSRTPGVFDLSGLGSVEAGESVIFTEDNPETFRSDWELCEATTVIGPYTNNIGRNDEINIYDPGDQLADQLTYGDGDFPGSIRTQGASGWVSAAGLGANDPFEWTLSIVGDTEDSWTSANGDIASPGISTHGGFDPCDEPADTGEQTIHVTVPDVVEPGEFVWSIDGDPNVQMTEAANAGSYLQSTGELTPIIVTDTRESGPEWSLSGQVSDFNDGLSGSFLGWTPSVIMEGAGATAGDPVASGFESGNGLSDVSTLAFATAGHELGTGTVGADLDLRIPVDTAAGDYSATLTITGLS